MKASAMNAAALKAPAHTVSPSADEPDEAIVDLFAGGGGASTGIFLATGRHPDVAVNHDPEAVALHAMNHPQTRHYCCDVHEVDPVEACSDRHGNLRRVALLWASPDCTHHSKARGGKPADKKIRALAWVVTKWASKVKPRCIFLENVEEFQDWCDLGEDGRPDRTQLGSIFRLWKSQFEAMGYVVECRVLVAADYGAPTTRKRLAVIMRNDGQPIVWPEHTHAQRDRIKAPTLFDPPMKPWRSAAEDVIDWSIPCPSIFDRKKDLAPKTQARIAKGIKRFVIEAKTPFVVPVTNGTWNPDRSWPVDEPLRTVTASKGGDYALVNALISGASVGVGGRAGQSPPRGIDDPVNTVTAKADRAIAAATLVPRYGEREGQEPRAISVEDPYPTVVPTGNGGDIAAVHITKFSENSIGTDPTEPLHTAMAGATRHGLVAAHLTKFRDGSSGASEEEPMPTVTANSFVKRPGCGIPLGHVEAALSPFVGRQFGRSVGSDADAPVGTVTAGGGGKTQLVAAHLGRQFGTAVGRDLEEPHPTVMTDGAGAKSYVAAACLTSYYGNGDGAAVDVPLPTVVTKDRHAPAVAFMEQANTGVVGHEATDPVSTILAAGCHQRPVECELATSEDPAPSKRAKVLAFLRKHFGEPTAEEAADPAGSVSARLKHGLVLIGQALWQIADIGMRMLTPRELYNAQGFPRDYIIDHTDRGPLTKTAQTRMAGNSVSPPWAAAIIRANDPLRQKLRVA